MDQLTLYSDSILTDEYQTIIPEMVRKALHLKKLDKIRYTIKTDGTVFISRAAQNENDHVLAQFLTLLSNDINENSKNLSLIDSDLVERIQPLVSDVEIDLNSPLSDEEDYV